jgi:bacterioferritin (cytochrome b1)
MKKNDSEQIQPVEAPVKKTGRRSMLDAGVGFAAIAALGALATACGDDDGGEEPAGSGGKATGSGGSGSGGKASSGGSGGKAAGGAGGTGSTTGSGGVAPDGGSEPDPDIEGLNALLTAEYFAITAYGAGAGLITGAAPADPLYALRQVIVDVAVGIQAQHTLHAEALVEAIESLNGTPVVKAEIEAQFEAPAALLANKTISNVLKYAAGQERNAAVAYNTVLAGFESAKFRFLASSIEGDETQHFIVLAALVLGLASPGPNLSSDTAADVFPAAFVYTVGDQGGLDAMPEDFFP